MGLRGCKRGIMKRIIAFLLILITSTPAFARDYTADSGCLAAWLFKEGSGTTVADSCGHGNTGTFKSSGHPTWSATVPSFHSYGTSANSASFASGDYINSGTGSNLNTIPKFTLVAWVYATGDGGNNRGRIFDKEFAGTSPGGWQIAFDASGLHHLSFTVAATSSMTFISSTALSLNAWHLVVVTWDGSLTASNSHLYQDNTEVSYGTQTNGSGSVESDANNPLAIGNVDDFSSDRTWAGYISQAAIFNRVLTTAELTDIYNNGLTGNGSFMKFMGATR